MIKTVAGTTSAPFHQWGNRHRKGVVSAFARRSQIGKCHLAAEGSFDEIARHVAGGTINRKVEEETNRGESNKSVTDLRSW